MNIQGREITRYLKSTIYVFVLMAIIASVAGMTNGMAADDSRPVITPEASEYARTASPKFNIEISSNRYYKVQLALAKPVFGMTDTDAYKIASGERQNFYSTDWLDCGNAVSAFAASGDVAQCQDGVGTFTLSSDVWSNLRGSLVFYRLLANSSRSDGGALISDIGLLRRTGESWYGFPLNDRAQVYDSVARANIYVVVNGVLQGRALESDFGPRDASGSRFHGGLDISVVLGTPVYAIADGRVSAIPGADSTAHRVNIGHNNNAYYSGYVHLDKWLVAAGEDVKGGQLIGYSGDWVDGQHGAVHLHFEAGFTDRNPFNNPLNRVTHTDAHQVTTDNRTFLGDSKTNNHPIDLANVSGDAHKLFVGFGVTTSVDKDLNYLKVQVDNSTISGQYFEFDYDKVISQVSSTGFITLSEKGDESYVLVHRSDYSIFTDPNFNQACRDKAVDCGMHVVPAVTITGDVAKDYFFFPWDLAPFEGNENGGPHTILVTVGEADGNEVTNSLTIGPDVVAGPAMVNGRQISYELTVVNHDFQAGEIALEVKGLPASWNASISNDIPYIVANGSEKINLTLTAPDTASMTPLCDSNTRVVGTFLRMQAFKDTAELCPKVWIDGPKQGAEFTEGDIVPVIVKIRSGLTASSVRLSVAGGQPQSMVNQGNNTWQYQWTVPTLSETTKTFSLQAIASIQGESADAYSADVDVIVKKKSETKIVTILSPNDGQQVKPGESINIEVYADLGVTDVQLTIDNQVQTLTKISDTKYTATWPVPSSTSNGKQYVLRASGNYAGKLLESSTVTITVVVVQTGEVTFKTPTHGSSVMVGNSVTVEVYAPKGAQDVYLSITPTDGGSGGWMTNTGQVEGENEIWKLSGWGPKNISTSYSLQATAHMPGGQQIHSYAITVYVVPAQATIEVQPAEIKVNDDVTVTVKAKDALNVWITANGAELSPKSHTDTEWLFSWKPLSGGNYLLRATVHYLNGDQHPERMVEVIDESQNMIIVEITEPKQGRMVYVGVETKIVVESPGLLRKVEVEITDKDNNVEKKSVTYESELWPGAGFPWTPVKEGKYRLKAYAWSAEGYKGWTDVIEVTAIEMKPEDVGIWTPINEFSFLWENKNPILADFYEGDYFNDWTPKFFNTMIPYSEYYCGVVGIAAHGGDIGEKAGNDQIIQVYADKNYSADKGTWHLMLDFITWNEIGTITKSLVDRKETWDIQLLCIDRDVISTESSQPGKSLFLYKQFTGLGDNVGGSSDVSTGFDYNEYVCGIIGFDSNKGDIQEFDDGDIILSYLFRKNNTWHIRAEFRTHSSQHENWNINVLCIHRDWAAIDNPQAGKPFVLKEYTNLGDNINYPTEFSVNEWTCGVVGFAARDGDIDEHDKDDNANLILAYMSEGAEKWHIRADFRTHNDGESWDVNVLCVRKDLSKAPEMLSATPVLFNDLSSPGILYGPGMALTWTETYHPDAEYYRIEFSEDGGSTWQLIDDQRPISYGGWRNHHGNLQCGYQFGRCLNRNQRYSYRVQVLDGAQQPISGWSNVVSGTSMEWPAHVDLALPIPKGPYYASPSTVTLNLVDTYGYKMRLTWQITPWSGAAYTIKSGCQEGNYSCVIEIRDESNTSVSGLSGTSKLSALAPVTSVDVLVVGESVIDGKTYRSDDKVSLFFAQECSDPTCGNKTTFKDVPPEHWANGYVEELYNDGYVSGCKAEGELEFCIDQEMTRAEMAVVVTRAHYQQQGYTPAEPEANPFADATGEWPDKWMVELYNLGFTAGCSRDPLKFCPWDHITRAQMTVYLERVVHGVNYQPPDDVEGFFVDVPKLDANGNRNWQFTWVHGALRDGLIQACGTDMEGKRFDPERIVTRDEMACGLYYAVQTRDAQ